MRSGNFDNENNNTIIYYGDESFKIVGAAMKVYNKLGAGFLEEVYQEAFEIELQRQNIPYAREKKLDIMYDGKVLNCKYKADFVCYGRIIVELKAVHSLNDDHRAQVLNYLHVTGFKLGLLLNFCNPNGLQSERILN